MKKVYLLFMMVSFTVALFAQSARPTAMTAQQAKNVMITKQLSHPKAITPLKPTGTPTRGTNGLISSPYYIGTTYQEQQTNYNHHNTVAVFPDGTYSVVWMTAPRNGSTMRGTGYNYFNGTSWLNAYDEIERIENERTGWPCIAPLGNNGEIVVAHNGSTGLVISYRAQKGTGQWSYSTLQGPTVYDANGENPSTALLWPDLATNGNTIHLIAVTESDAGYYYNGINRCLLYYRGTYDETSNTITWESPRVVFNATAAEQDWFVQDHYNIAANGNTVAILYCYGYHDVRIWKSSDNGVNFNTIMLFDNPVKDDNDMFDVYDPNIVPDTVTINYIPKDISTITVGPDGKVHVAFDLYRMKWAGWDESTSTPGDTVMYHNYWPTWNYELVYWNEDMPVFVGRQALDVDTLAANGYTTFGLVDLDGDDTVRYLNNDYWADNIQGSIVSYPQIAVEGNNVCMIYTSMLEWPLLASNTLSGSDVIQLHGIFGVRSTDGGHSWNNGTSWLSYCKDVYYADNWSVYTQSFDIEDLELIVDYDAIFPAMGKQVTNGKVLVDWMTDPFPDIVSNQTNQVFVMAKFFTADSIGIYNNTDEIHQDMWIDPTGIADNTLEGMKLYPNPATDNLSVAISSSENASADLTIVNLMGQMVYNENVALTEGNNILNLNVSNLKAGVYMVNIRTNKGTSTQKLIVK